jgi:26S proteasome regulatory subunit N9
VEHLVMKALSLNLIRGSIDQVDQTVNITWVQPRVLDRDQIDGMRKRLDTWNKDVDKIATFVQQEGGEVFAQ